MARAIETQIEAEVVSDPRREFGVEQWHNAVDSTIDYIKARPVELRSLHL